MHAPFRCRSRGGCNNAPRGQPQPDTGAAIAGSATRRGLIARTEPGDAAASARRKNRRPKPPNATPACRKEAVPLGTLETNTGADEMMTTDNDVQEMIPLVYWLREMADQFIPDKGDESETVGHVLADALWLKKSRSMPDDERIKTLEAIAISLAMRIYRQEQAAFEQYMSESAEFEVINALNKMREQPSNPA